MRLFVTGGAGFIGSNYVRRVLATTDDEVTVFDLLTYAGNLSTLRDVDGNPRYRLVQGDICDREAVTAAMSGHDAVVHFAAESHVDRSIVSPDAFVRTNCDGTNVLCDVARQVGVERFVHISPDEVYGSIETGSFSETDPLSPRSPYSASKAGSDLIALAYRETYGLPVVVTRSSNNFGPYQFPEKVIPLFTARALDGQALPLYASTQNRREWLHVVDHCRAIELVLQHGSVGETYNVGSGTEASIEEIADAVLAATDQPASLKEIVPDRPGHDRRYLLDSSKIRSSLGWEPSVSFDHGLAETVSWYRENRSWWEPLRDRSPVVEGDWPDPPPIAR